MNNKEIEQLNQILKAKQQLLEIQARENKIATEKRLLEYRREEARRNEARYAAAISLVQNGSFTNPLPDGVLTFEGETEYLTFEGETDYITIEN